MPRRRSAFLRLGFFLPTIVVLFAMGATQQGAAQSLGGVLPSGDLFQSLQQRLGNSANDQSADTVQPGTNSNPTIQMPDKDVSRTPLPESRLETILSSRAGVRLRQFGYDQLGRGRAVAIPQTGAVQDSYVLGPGDQIAVVLRGQENSELRTTVNRDGQVVLPRLSPIAATGRSFGSFRQDVESAVHRAYVATEASVSIGRVRQISVLVSGEVNVPGQRIVSGLASAVDALLLSGGVKKSGSLRRVFIQRGAHRYVVDLYGVLTGSGRGADMALTDGDRIVVPPLGPVVAVTGLVRLPGIYELPAGQSGMTARALLALSGGQEVRGRYRLSILRIDSTGRSAMVAAGDNDRVQDSEILFVQLGANQTASQATLAGGTPLAGSYPVASGTRLSDVVRQPGALPTSPYTLFGLVSRKDSRTFLRQLFAFTPIAVLSGKEDQPLQADDIVRTLSLNEMRLVRATLRLYMQRQNEEQRALRDPLSAITNASQQPQSQQQQQPVQPQQSQNSQYAPVPQQNTAGGITNTTRTAADEASQQESDIKLIGSLTQHQIDMIGSGQVQLSDFQYMDEVRAPDQGVYLASEVNARLAAQQQAQNVPALPATSRQNPVQGISPLAQNQTAQDPQARTEQAGEEPARLAANFESQSPLNGTFPNYREVPNFNILAQQLNVDPVVLINFFNDHQATLDGAVRGPGIYFVGPGVALQDLVQAAGGTANWADESGVELISTAIDSGNGRAATQRSQLPLNQGELISYIVKPFDEFRFNQVFNDARIGSVTVQGEVRFKGTYQITRGERLSELLSRAGGLTNTAYPYGTVFLRQSIADKERDSYIRTAKDIEDQLIVAMTRVGTDKIAPETFTSMQNFVNDLRNQKAVGRVSIVADPSVLAAKPELDPLLEPGDVVYIPQRPTTVSVLGQVMQAGTFPYRASESLDEYIQQAGGYSPTADDSNVYIVLPDGTARKSEKTWLQFSATALPPGSTIVVPRDVTPLDLRQTVIDISQIFSQFAVAIASVAVLSKQ